MEARTLERLAARGRGNQGDSRDGGPALLLLALLVVALAGVARVGMRTVLPDPSGVGAFQTLDPDGHYHMRRVDRALTEGGVAATDPLLTGADAPEGGASIPWPAGATHLLAAAARLGGVPEEAEPRRAWVERVVGSSAMVFGALLAGLVAWVAGGLARARGGGRAGVLLAAATAGVGVALAPASLRYSHLGMGDHHALATLLGFGTLAAYGRLLRDPSARVAAAAGALGALGISVWMPLLAVPSALGLWGLLGLRSANGTTRALALALALSALLTAPLAIGSPWPPWSLLEPAWGTPGLLAVLGSALAARAAGAEGARRAPVLRLGSLAFAAAFLALAGRGILGEAQRALAWAAGSQEFMAGIAESRSPMSGPFDLAGLAAWTGPVLWLALPALVVRGLGLWRPVAFLLLLAGCLQARFTEPLVPALALAAGVGVAALHRRLPARARGVLVAVPVALAALSPGSWLEGLRSPRPESPQLVWQRGVREAAAWLRGRGQGAVLAQWDLGHALEWVGERRSVATNFGSYLGREPFLAPWRVLASEDDIALEELDRWGATHLLWTSRWRRNEEPLAASLGIERLGPKALFVRLERLEDLPGTLRLVYESPADLRDRVHGRDSQPLPVARVFERVPGALLELAAEPGEVLRVDLRLRIEGVPQDLQLRLEQVASEEGSVRLRLPYATDGRMGAARVVGEVRWSCGASSGAVEVPEASVRAGASILLKG